MKKRIEIEGILVEKIMPGGAAESNFQALLPFQFRHRLGTTEGGNSVRKDNYFILLASEGVIFLMLKPIEKAVEHYLLAGVIKRKRMKAQLEM